MFGHFTYQISDIALILSCMGKYNGSHLHKALVCRFRANGMVHIKENEAAKYYYKFVNFCLYEIVPESLEEIAKGDIKINWSRTTIYIEFVVFVHRTTCKEIATSPKNMLLREAHHTTLANWTARLLSYSDWVRQYPAAELRNLLNYRYKYIVHLWMKNILSEKIYLQLRLITSCLKYVCCILSVIYVFE